MAETQYVYLQHLHHVHNMTITLSAVWQPDLTPVPMQTHVRVLANILQYVHTSQLRTLSLHVDMGHSIIGQEKEYAAFIAPTLGLEGDTSGSVTGADTLGCLLRETEHLILQFPVLIAMWFDITIFYETRMRDGLVEQIFPRLQKKGVLRTTVAVSSSNLTSTKLPLYPEPSRPQERPIIAISGDGNWIIVLLHWASTPRTSHTILLIDIMESLSYVRDLPPTCDLRTLSFHPNLRGWHLVSKSLHPPDGCSLTIHHAAIDLPHTVWTFAGPHTFCFCVSWDGFKLASAASEDSTVRIWSLTETCQAIAVGVFNFKFQDRECDRMDLDHSGRLGFSPDGTTLVLYGWDVQIAVWRENGLSSSSESRWGTDSILSTCPAFEHRIIAAVFDAASTRLAMFSHQRVVTIVSLATGEVLVSLHTDSESKAGPLFYGVSLEFSLDGQQILWATPDRDGGVYLCDDFGQGHIRSIGAIPGRVIRSVTYAHFSPDGRYILSGDSGHGLLWRTCDGTLLWTTEKWINDMRFAAGSDGQNVIFIWNDVNLAVYSRKEAGIPDPQLSGRPQLDSPTGLSVHVPKVDVSRSAP
ncbi:hypothetical protein C8Q76DRAFT_253896 [Earliella scabrosa]|nr:hypothetical protein C8Q76DRAFT_253896 [Earliella scabrosa]